jgi:hypothetical protein
MLLQAVVLNFWFYCNLARAHIAGVAQRFLLQTVLMAVIRTTYSNHSKELQRIRRNLCRLIAWNPRVTPGKKYIARNMLRLFLDYIVSFRCSKFDIAVDVFAL